MSRGDPARETLLSVASPSADSLSSSLLHGPRSSPSLLPSLPVSSLESLSPGGSCLVPLCDYRLSLRCAVFIVRFFLRCSLCSTVFSFVSVSSRMEQDRRAFLSLSLSLSLSHSLFVHPFLLFLSRFSRLFLPVNRPLRCTRTDSYIYHALLSSSLLLGRGSLFRTYSYQPSSALLRTRFVLSSFFSADHCRCCRCCCFTDDSLYIRRRRRVGLPREAARKRVRREPREPSFFSFYAVFRPFSRLEGSQSSRYRARAPLPMVSRYRDAY